MIQSIVITEELRGYLPLLCRVLSGEHSGLHQEKLCCSGKRAGDLVIYSLRINIHDRLLYTFAFINGEHCLVVLGDVRSHDYHKSRFLRSKGVLGAYLDKHILQIEKVLAADKVDAKDSSYESIEDTTEMTGETIVLPTDEPLSNRHLLIQFGKRYLVKDERQESCLLVQHKRQEACSGSTVIISGSSGTGKTVSAMLYIKANAGATRPDGDPVQILYVTSKPGLVERVKRELSSALTDEASLNITFSTYDGLIAASRGDLATRHVKRNEVERFISASLKRTGLSTHYALLGDVGGDKEAIKVIHDEWILIAGLGELKKYLNLGDDQSYVAKEHKNIREDIYHLYEAFKKTLKADEVYVPFHKFNQAEISYDSVIIDESFLLSFSNVAGLSDRAQFTMLLGDSHQAVRAHWLSVFSSTKPSIEHIALNENHRNTHSIISILNRALALKFYLRSGLRDKYEQGKISSSFAQENCDDDILWIDKSWCTKHDTEIRNWVSSSQFAVVVLCNEEELDRSEIAQKKARAQAIFDTPLIFTRKEIQGLEYPVVVVMIDENISLLNNKLKRGFSSEIASQSTPINRSAQKGVTYGQQTAIDLINQMYVAFSRAQRELVVYVGEDASVEGELLTYLKGANQANLHVPQLSASSAQTWQEERKRQSDEGNTDTAAEIGRKHGMSEKNGSRSSEKADIRDSLLFFSKPLNTPPANEHSAAAAAAAAYPPPVIRRDRACCDVKEDNNGAAIMNSAPKLSEKWKTLVTKFQDQTYLSQKNIEIILNSKDPEIINWVLFAEEVKKGEGDSIFIQYLKHGKGLNFLMQLERNWIR